MGLIQRHRLVTDADKVGPHEITWLSGEGSEPILEILDMTFYTIHQHLISLMESGEVDWEEPKARKGIEAMFALAFEAARIMDKYLAFRLGKDLGALVEERPSYQELHYFYHHRFASQLNRLQDELWKEGAEED